MKPQRTPALSVLEKLPRMDDALEAVERRQDRRRMAAEIGEHIVLDDAEVSALPPVAAAGARSPATVRRRSGYAARR
jgi:hypothetical protein